MHILYFASQLINVALGKCISIENATATLGDCDGSSEVGGAGVSLTAGAVDDTGVVDEGGCDTFIRSLEIYFFL